jgi:hypothetical protein
VEPRREVSEYLLADVLVAKCAELGDVGTHVAETDDLLQRASDNLFRSLVLADDVLSETPQLPKSHTCTYLNSKT